jgi:hypothetical protein
MDFDETKEDPAFALLASVARYPETIFDLRPISQILHQISEGPKAANGGKPCLLVRLLRRHRLLSSGDAPSLPTRTDGLAHSL